MSRANSAHSVDILRKSLIVVALVVGVVVLHLYAAPTTTDPRGLMALGFVILAAYTIGELAEVFKLPHITGYLMAGLLLGPSVAHELAHFLPIALPPPFDEGILSEAVIGQLSLLDTLALPLIALTAGGELHVDELKKGLKPILGVLTGQTITLMLAFMAFVLVVGGAIPGIGLPALSALDLPGKLIVGTVLGALALATSAAATIAIILGAGARGPMTRTVLSVVVLKDVAVVVLFAATTAAAAGILGTGADGGLLVSLGHIGLSVVIGVAVGGLVHIYLRFIAVERLLFLVALIYTTAFLCGVLHAEVALVFIAAGFVVANFSDQGEVLIHDVERLSLPVFVVFFTLAGARLHVDVIVQMAGYATLLVLVRAAAIYAGVKMGGRLSGADENTQKYGWMGMIAQAGLAISLAGQLPAAFPGPLGEELFALVLAGVAVHEVAGPALLQVALGLAGEIPTDAPTSVEDAVDTQEPHASTGEESGWGAPLVSLSVELRETMGELETDLKRLVSDVRVGQAGNWSADAQIWVQSIRKAFVRVHRRAALLAKDPHTDEARFAALVVELESAWRSAVWARAASEPLDSVDPTALIRVIDQRLDGIPTSIAVPVAPETLAPRAESTARAIVRSCVRFLNDVSPRPREVAVRDLCRYHIGGVAIGRLEGVVAPQLRAELDMGRRIGVMFAEVVRRWPHSGGEEAEAQLLKLRNDVLGALQTIVDELETAGQDVGDRLDSILGTSMGQVKAELPVLGGIDLPHWTRRFGRVYNERNDAVNALTENLQAARDVLAARFRAVGAEMEVASLQATAGAAVRVRAAGVGRLVDDLGVRPLRAVDSSVVLSLTRIDEFLRTPTEPNGRALAQRVRESIRNVEVALVEGRRLLDLLEDQLHQSCTIAVTDDLHTQVSQLTEAVDVPSGPVEVGDWTLPRIRPLVTLQLREGVRAWLDTRVGAALDAAAANATEVITAARAAVIDLERVVAFNTDLAVAELDVFPNEPPSIDTRDLVWEMLHGAIGRSHHRVTRTVEAMISLQRTLPQTVNQTVPQVIGELCADLVQGNIAPLRRLTDREARFKRELRRTAGALGIPTPQAFAGLRDSVQHVLGIERWQQVTGWLSDNSREADWVDVSPPQPLLELPLVYRRLFTDQVVAGVELSHHREQDLSRAAAVLQVSSGLRSVVVVAEDAASQAMLVDRLLRKIHGAAVVVGVGRDGLASLAAAPSGPALIEDIGAWFQHTPTGMDLLSDLSDAILAGDRPWILAATPEAWATVARHSPLGRAVVRVVDGGVLNATELQTAILGRHAMSGYSANFDVDGLLGIRLSRVLRLEGERHDADRDAWFRHLHVRAKGRLSDALQLWMAAIQEVNEELGYIRIGPIPPGLPRSISHIEDEDLLLLRRAAVQSGLTPLGLAEVAGLSTRDARATLAALTSRGLLANDDGDVYVVPGHLTGPVRDAIRLRGWSL